MDDDDQFIIPRHITLHFSKEFLQKHKTGIHIQWEMSEVCSSELGINQTIQNHGFVNNQENKPAIFFINIDYPFNDYVINLFYGTGENRTFYPSSGDKINL